MRKSAFPFAILLLLTGLPVLTACRPTTAPTPVPVTFAAPAIVASPNIVIITATPRPTITPTPAPTLPYNPKDYEGTWSLLINYQIYNGDYWADVRYNGGVALTVTATGEISGTGIFYPTLQQPPCPSFVNGTTGLPMKVTGNLDADADGKVIGRLQIVPDNPKAIQEFILSCTDPGQGRGLRRALLWPALEATDQLNLTLPFAPATVRTSLRSLSTASGGRLYGTLLAEIRLNR
jgi:hypothetical protein